MPPRILICDDETVMRELVRAVLEDGYEFSDAGGGDECLELARQVKPDLLILDMMLPGKDGLEVLGELRADPAFGSTRILVLTAWSHLEGEALGAGADAFVVKPFEPDDLRQLVADLLPPADGRSGGGAKI